MDTYKPEEVLVEEEEFTTCPAHPDVVFERGTDCPRCMRAEAEEEWYLDSLPDEDPFCLPAVNSGVDETQFT